MKKHLYSFDMTHIRKKIYALLILALFSFNIPVDAQNMGLEFGGSNDGVLISNYTGSGTKLTVEAWVYADSRPQWANVAANWGDGTSGEFHFGLYNTEDCLGAHLTESDGNIVLIKETGVDFPLDSWQHVTLIADGSNLYLLRNGIIVAGPIAYDGTLKNSFQYLGIGSKSNDAGTTPIYSWDGMIDEVRIWSDDRTQEEIRANMYKELVGSESNLVGYYKLNETSGTTTDNAEETAALDGTLTNMTGSEWTPSPAFFGPKNCLDLDGSDDYIDCGVVSELDITDNTISIEAWIYPTDFQANYWLNSIAGNDNTGIKGYVFRYGATGILSFTYANGGIWPEVTSSNNALTINKWQHVAVIYDGSNMKLYVNGIEKGTTATSSSITTSPSTFKIGASSHSGRQMKGKIDEVRIWSDARTIIELRENMHQTLVGDKSGLVGYFNFDNESGTTLQDFSGNNNDGTLTNMDDADWVSSTAFNTWLNTNTTTAATAANWSSGSAPVSTDNVGIPNHSGSEPSTSSAISCNNLVVNSGATLTVTSNTLTVAASVFNEGALTVTGTLTNNNSSSAFYNGGTLTDNGAITVEDFTNSGTVDINEDKEMTVENDLSNTGTFTLNSSSTGTGSLWVKGTSTGNIIAERYIGAWSDSEHGWHFLSAPVASQNISTEFVDISATPISANVDFFRWSESEDLWINIRGYDKNYNQGALETHFSNDANPQFETGKGYLVAYSSIQNKTFTGALSTSNVSVSNLSLTADNTYTGAHLLGNPFACALEWNATTGASGWDLSGIDATAKIWNESGAAYTDIAQNGIIPAMQGFMVIANTDNASLTIYEGDRTHSTTGWYKSTSINHIKLTAHNTQTNTAQETNISFNEDATNDFDHEFDSPFMSGYAPLFYSKINGIETSTNTLPELDESLRIPLYFTKNSSTEYYIQAEGLENLEPAYPVFLLDKKTGYSQNLSENSIYNFHSAEGDATDRFVLHFKATAIDNLETQDIQIFAYQKTINIRSSEKLINAHFNIVDMMGRVVHEQAIVDGQNELITLPLEDGVYLVQLVSDGGTQVEKVVLKM